MNTGTKLGIVALALAVGTVALWFYLARQVDLPDDRTFFVIAFLCAAVLGVAAFVRGTSIPGGLPPALAILIGLFLPFTILISPQKLDTAKVIGTGDTIPHFTATDGRGEAFDSASLHGQLVLIKFFRGHW
jgi:peptidoglycan/LPS O-acetylase OafA/YrhL